MTEPSEPQDISDDEADLGFQCLEVDGMGRRLEPQVVVARILSASDILVKVNDPDGKVRYSHRRFGYDKTLDNRSVFRWRPLSSPIAATEAAILIQEYDFVPPDEAFPGDIVGVPFTYRTT